MLGPLYYFHFLISVKWSTSKQSDGRSVFIDRFAQGVSWNFPQKSVTMEIMVYCVSRTGKAQPPTMKAV